MIQEINRPFLAMLTLAGLLATALPAQQLTRSGIPAQSHPALGPATIPCSGATTFSDDFQSGVGAWTVLDLDGRTPNATTGLAAGWQGRADYRDTTDRAAVSPSWYSPVGKSEDWLISPSMTLGGNPCLSWEAYSQDQYFKESYEVRISTSGIDTASFTALPALYTTTGETDAPTIRSVSLAAYAGQTVRIAFRQTSNDKFVLVLDDVKVSEVANRDIGVLAFEAPTADPGDTLSFEIQVANYGSDTVRSFQVRYSVEGGAAQAMTIDSITLAPNGVHTFTHSATFITDTLEAFYDFCAWTSLPNGLSDEVISNDSLCDRFKAGTPVGIQPGAGHHGHLSLYPNPAQGQAALTIDAPGQGKPLQITLLDLQGRVMRSYTGTHHPARAHVLALQGLPAGVYIVRAQVAGQSPLSRKLIVD